MLGMYLTITQQNMLTSDVIKGFMDSRSDILIKIWVTTFEINDQSRGLSH